MMRINKQQPMNYERPVGGSFGLGWEATTGGISTFNRHNIVRQYTNGGDI